MSVGVYDIAEESLVQDGGIDERWEQEIVPHLPKELEEQAWLTGAMQRKSGKLTRASDLLRGLLAYVLCVSSFRGLGAWGVIQGVVDMADTSWRDRLRKASEWLSWIVSQQLRPDGLLPCPWLKKAGYGAVELVDATHLKCVGLHGRTWRIHCLYSLLTMQIRQLVVSSMKVAENLQHFVLQAGSIYVHDSGYGYRDRVAQATEAGAYTVTAFYPGSFPLEDEQAKSFEVVKWLKKQRARAGKICCISVFFRHGGKRYEARVVGLRRTEQQAQRMRRRKKKKAGQDHRKLQGETLYLAGWLLVLRTLPAADWSAQEVLSLYRARWHIEVLFKRIKQLLCQHILRAETEETARATVYAILVSWVLQHEVALELRANLQEMYLILEEEGKTMIEDPTNQERQEEPAISEWQVQALSVNLFRQQVQGVWSRQRLFDCLPLLRRHLGERRRKRPHQWQQVHRWLVDPAKAGPSEAGSERKTAVSARSTAFT